MAQCITLGGDGVVPLVCPRCLRGKLILHTSYRYVYVRLVQVKLATTAWVSCSRSKNCGWWMPLTAEGTRASALGLKPAGG